MLLAVLAVAALAWWLHGQGRLLPNLVRLGGAAAAGLVALRLLETGRVAAAAAVALAGYGWWRWADRRPAARVLAAARLLGVPADAGSDVVWDAWRRAMARAHPDAGGSDEAAQALTAARDLLVAHAARRRTR